MMAFNCACGAYRRSHKQGAALPQGVSDAKRSTAMVCGALSVRTNDRRLVIVTGKSLYAYVIHVKLQSFQRFARMSAGRVLARLFFGGCSEAAFAARDSLHQESSLGERV